MKNFRENDNANSGPKDLGFQNESGDTPLKGLGRLLTRKETAELFQVSCVTLYNWDKAGELTAKRIGGRVYYSYNDILAKLTDSVN